MQKSSKIGILFLLLLVFSMFPFVNKVSAQSQETSCTQANGYMECVTTQNGCKHRSCASNVWGSYVEFSSNGNGNYACASNTNGGGERCKFTKNFEPEAASYNSCKNSNLIDLLFRERN